MTAKSNAEQFCFESGWGIAFALILSFAAKVVIRLIALRNANFWETGYAFYFQIAKHILEEGEFYYQSAHAAGKLYAIRPPLYPLFIALLCNLTNYSAQVFIVAQTFVATCTAFFAYKIAFKLADAKAAVFAAVFCAFYPYSFFHDTQLQENAVYNFFSLASIWSLMIAAEKEKSLSFLKTGVVLGFATLTKASHLVHAFFLFLWILLRFRRQLQKGLIFTAACAFGFLLCLSPWLIRNKRVIGSYALTSIAGRAFVMAHNEFTFALYPYKGSIDDSDQYLRPWLKGKGEAYPCDADFNKMTQNRLCLKMAANYIVNHKLETLRRGVYKVAVNFLGILSPLSNPVKNISYFLSYWSLTLLMIAGLRKIWKSDYFKIYLVLCFSQAVFSFIFWAHSSHRSFLDPMLAVLAGVSLASLLRAIYPLPGVQTK